ncbi:MAG: cobalt-precorrin 5A hydrolase, partial [bacterium]
RDTAARIAEVLTNADHICRTFALPKFCKCNDEPLTVSAGKWAEAAFAGADGLIFCCAAGIAVRAIAPYVKDKTTDPAVIVADEFGRFIIPLLSGHLGGANALARLIAGGIGGTAVITTATDLNDVFAVDVFALKNHLYIEETPLAKAVSAALLSGMPVGFCSDLPWQGFLPPGLTETSPTYSALTPGIAEVFSPQSTFSSRPSDHPSLQSALPSETVKELSADSQKTNAELGICISKDCAMQPFQRTLHLIPKRYAAGIGCKQGKTESELEVFLLKQLNGCGVSPKELRCIASIDLKKDEPGLLELCEKLRLPLLTFAAEELAKVPGKFTESAFVKEHTGVDSVCERAAVLASGGHLSEKKVAENGMTFALAVYEEAIVFE